MIEAFIFGIHFFLEIVAYICGVLAIPFVILLACVFIAFIVNNVR